MYRNLVTREPICRTWLCPYVKLGMDTMQSPAYREVHVDQSRELGHEDGGKV